MLPRETTLHSGYRIIVSLTLRVWARGFSSVLSPWLVQFCLPLCVSVTLPSLLRRSLVTRGCEPPTLMASLTLMFFRGPVSKGSQPYSAVLRAQYADMRLHNPAGERSKLIDGRDSGGGGGWWGGGVGSASCPHAFLGGGQNHTCKDLKSHRMGRRSRGRGQGEGREGWERGRHSVQVGGNMSSKLGCL